MEPEFSGQAWVDLVARVERTAKKLTATAPDRVIEMPSEHIIRKQAARLGRYPAHIRQMHQLEVDWDRKRRAEA